MARIRRAKCVVRSLLILSMAAVIAALPLACVAFHSNPGIVLLILSEEAPDGESGSLELDVSGLFALVADVDDLAVPAYAHRVADDLAATDSALAESHLQRGPPGC